MGRCLQIRRLERLYIGGQITINKGHSDGMQVRLYSYKGEEFRVSGSYEVSRFVGGNQDDLRGEGFLVKVVAKV